MLRRWSLNAALTFASLLLALSPLEIGLRLYDGIPLPKFANFIGEVIDLLKGDATLDYDGTLGWRPKANLHAAIFDTGAYGVRIADGAGHPIPTGAILASGDSFTFGSDVGNSETWPAYLEAMIGTPVVNAAAPGWGTDQIVLRAEQMIDIARPKTVIVSFLWYDIGRAEEEIEFGAHKPYYTIGDGKLVQHNVPVPRLSSRPDEIGLARAVLGYSYAIYWAAQRLGLDGWLGANTHKRATPGGTGIQISCLLMQRLKARADAGGIRLMLVMQYGAGDFERPEPQPALAVLRCAGDLGIAAVDTWVTLAEIHANDAPRFRSLFLVQDTGWSHMSAAGNRHVASMVAEQLQDPQKGTASRH